MRECRLRHCHAVVGCRRRELPLKHGAQQADDQLNECCQVPDEALAAASTDTTMFGTTSLLSFSELVDYVAIDAVVKVVYKYKESNASHTVVIEPNGFQNCAAACRF